MQLYAIGKYHLSILTTTACYSDEARDMLTTEAMMHNPDYILWIDADQVYPKDTPEILKNHIDDGKLIVGGLTPHGGSGQPLVYDMVGPLGPCWPKEVSLHQGLIKIDAMGLGGIMMSPEVFKIMKSPWFRMIWNKKEGFRPGMDFQFYGNCKKAGIDIWCDTDLIFGHVAVGLIEAKENKPKINIA